MDPQFGYFRYFQIYDAGTYGALGLVGRKNGSNGVDFNFVLPKPVRTSAATWTWTGNMNGFRVVQNGGTTSYAPTSVTGYIMNNYPYQMVAVTAATTNIQNYTAALQMASGSDNLQKYEVDAEF